MVSLGIYNNIYDPGDLWGMYGYLWTMDFMGYVRISKHTRAMDQGFYGLCKAYVVCFDMCINYYFID